MARNCDEELMPKINFILRQSDEEIACLAIHEGRTILKLYLDEAELDRTAAEINAAKFHLVQSRNLNELIQTNVKKTRFPRQRSKLQ